MKITKRQLKHIIKEEIEQGLKEAGYFTTNMPDDIPTTADLMQKMSDTGEERMSPEEVAEEEVRDLADKFNVEAFVQTASDGKSAILVFHQNGEPTAYNDAEEMYQDLASRQEKI